MRLSSAFGWLRWPSDHPSTLDSHKIKECRTQSGHPNGHPKPQAFIRSGPMCIETAWVDSWPAQGRSHATHGHAAQIEDPVGPTPWFCFHAPYAQRGPSCAECLAQRSIREMPPGPCYGGWARCATTGVLQAVFCGAPRLIFLLETNTEVGKM